MLTAKTSGSMESCPGRVWTERDAAELRERGCQGASDSDLIEARLRGAASTSTSPRLRGLERALSRAVYEPDKAGAAGDLCFLLQQYKKLLDVHAAACRK